jgi:hypothetical protein
MKALNRGSEAKELKMAKDSGTTVNLPRFFYGGLAGLVTITFVPPAMTFFNVYAEIAV